VLVTLHLNHPLSWLLGLWDATLGLIVRRIIVGNELKLTHRSLPGHHTLHIKWLLRATWGVSGAAWWVAGLI
jgi:hypothetical protein